MSVKVKNWDGKNQEQFVNVAKAELTNVCLGEVIIEVPHNSKHPTIEDDDFHIFIWSTPEENEQNEGSIKPPESIWGIPVDCRDGAFPASGKGVTIYDGDYEVAELVEGSLFIHHDVCHTGSENEIRIFREILKRIKDYIRSPEKQWEEMSMDKKVKTILNRDYVFCDSMARILSLSFAGSKNAIVFGPGGHGKSAMVKSVIEGLGLAEDTFFQFFGEGMDEARLFGGLNFRKLEEEKVLEYYPEKSFLNYRIAVFEELFDAPASVLLALKDTLTAKELRNGDQRFPMKTESIIVLTNKDPDEVSELGPAAHALVERFPFHLDLRWPDYSAASYLRMFNKIGQRMEGPELNGSKQVLAEILAKATEEGNFISPRTAVHAYEAVQTSAQMRGAEEVSQEDFVDLRFIVGLEDLGESLQEDIKTSKAKAKAEQELGKLQKELESLEQDLGNTQDPIAALKLAKKLGQLEDKLSQVSVPDSLIDKKEGLREAVSNRISKAKNLAWEATEIE